MPAKNGTRCNRGQHPSSTPLDDPAVVPSTNVNVNRPAATPAGEEQSEPARSSHTGPDTQGTVDGLSLLRRGLESQKVPSGAAELMLRSWSKGTLKSYNSVLQRWTKFCSEREIDVFRATVTDTLNFLTVLYNSGVGFSVINTARSALSAILPMANSKPVGEHHLISRLMRGIKSTRPSKPRYNGTWNPNVVTSHLKSCENKTLKELTHSLVMLLALVTGQRAQTLHALKISDMTIEEELVFFTLSSPLKNRGVGEVIELVPFEDKKLCVVTLLHEYLFKTKEIRQGCDELFLSINKPNGPVTVDTIRRWVLTVLKDAGVNTSVFKAHSTRSAACSAALRKKVSLKVILKAGLWRSQNVFTKFYNREVHEVDGSFAKGVLL